MSLMERIAERKIKEALRDGHFDNLPGQGQPLAADDDSGVPEELRMAYKVLKNSGHLPPELQLRQDIISLRELMHCCDDPEERRRFRGNLSAMQLKLEMLLRSTGRVLPVTYENRVFDKLNDPG